MVDQGYDDDFSTAVTITSSCEGLLVPPGHNMVIYTMSAGGVSVGAVLFIGSAVGHCKMEKIVKATLPFYVCMIITLLLITFIPGIAMFLPDLLGN